MPKLLKQYTRVEIIRKPIKIKVKTKDGEMVEIKATKIIRKHKKIRFNVKPKGSKKAKMVYFTSRR